MQGMVQRWEATEKTPLVVLDPSSGRIEIAGCSIPENADRFFGPVFDAVDRYAEAPAARTAIRIRLAYFNSSSAKYLLDLLKRLDEAHARRTTKVQLEWLHAPGDEDMAEAGRDYESLVAFPVKVRESDD